MVHSKQPALEYDWECVRRLDWNYIHDPHLHVSQSRCKPASGSGCQELMSCTRMMSFSAPILAKNSSGKCC
jgi:hypothetical protein